ncbi:MAG TPA: undecaprenyl-diphosphate phosphatase [Rhizomicrobium sp.]|jgi:undecaprenyl-diphosphatase|nr:undecaprenyl-diphosphate phosphatase [Rhizomicrobium sp.]
MHDLLMAVLLGIVEGLTEFLPVSSTAHLLIAERLLGLAGDRWEAFTIVIQLGAILAVVAVYWRKFADILITLPRSKHAQQFTASVLIAFLPAAIAGALLIKKINAVLLDPETALPVIACTMTLGGIIILLFERIAPKPRYHDGDRLPLMKALQVGLCQVLAIVPGVSRSGATILGGELLGIERSAIAHFTFYLAVPTMFGATALQLYKKWAMLSATDLSTIAIGFVISFIVAYGVVKTFIGFLSRYGLKPFGWYRVVLGLILAIAWLAFR